MSDSNLISMMVTDGHTVQHSNISYGPSQIVTLPVADATRLAALGFLKAVPPGVTFVPTSQATEPTYTQLYPPFQEPS